MKSDNSALRQGTLVKVDSALYLEVDLCLPKILKTFYGESLSIVFKHILRTCGAKTWGISDAFGLRPAMPILSLSQRY
jgi:hypothetical protein